MCKKFEVSFSRPFDVAGDESINCRGGDYVHIEPGKKNSYVSSLSKMCGQNRPNPVSFRNEYLTRNKITFDTNGDQYRGVGFQAEICMLTCNDIVTS